MEVLTLMMVLVMLILTAMTTMSVTMTMTMMMVTSSTTVVMMVTWLSEAQVPGSGVWELAPGLVMDCVRTSTGY